MEKDISSNSNHKRTGVARISSKINFKTKNVTRDNERKILITRGQNHQESEIIINIYVPSRIVAKYIRLDRNEGRNRKLNNNRDFNTPFSITDRTTRQNKEIKDLSKTITQSSLDLHILGFCIMD